eukprot:CAMPEP_0181461158 /NCGR_PEP_ID=MMETSP1110-20121109/33730_1 /TAXON_ID=174948 /ORGANISM="Symbiodinium sp., Strain CCMP421" /LENGTH=271 /DNA_ID=CAMNT_0023585767 /DNA_START=41 /DNA_END=856 /DNA_ORIENTATION=+
MKEPCSGRSLEPVAEEAEVYQSCDSTHAPPSGRSSQGGHPKQEDTGEDLSEGLTDDPWRDCEDIAREDMISFLADFARLRQYEDAGAWAHEALLRLDEWGDTGGLPGVASSKKASETRVRQLRGWGCPDTDKTIELSRSSFQSESTMSSSGSRSTAPSDPSGYSIGSSHADSGPMSPPPLEEYGATAEGLGIARQNEETSKNASWLGACGKRPTQPLDVAKARQARGSKGHYADRGEVPESGGDGWISAVWTGIWSFAASDPSASSPSQVS